MPDGTTAANGSTDADFSTNYSYNLQGNILSTIRSGEATISTSSELFRT